ncbi:short chain dehydrogenase [Pseudonocardia spinosispora]|uniref:short chain dehydrogenase n=1 Tax=Pseudonocardia spinosispora TaxID=103441 RepID=UPI00041F2519|nr:short chain dehydrogenase [Pseudonocardia spinosispora]
MRIIVVGASGMLGRAVVAALRDAHDVIPVSRRSAVSVDLADVSSVGRLFTEVADVDSVVCCAANVPLTPLPELTDAGVAADVQAKMFGQVSLTLSAAARLNSGGSIVLTGGTFVTPIRGSSIGALVNTGLSGFVRSAAAELPRGLRLNLVSPGWISETLTAMGEDPASGTPVSVVADAYRALVEGTAQGTTVVPQS